MTILQRQEYIGSSYINQARKYLFLTFFLNGKLAKTNPKICLGQVS